MKIISDNVALNVLLSQQVIDSRRFTFYNIEREWIVFDITGQEISRIPATSEHSDFSGTIDHRGAKAKFLIYRLPNEAAWTIDYTDANNVNRNFGRGFLTDEDAFESFISSVCDGSVENI